MTKHRCSCRILVVDDDESIGALVCEMLKMDGYTVSSVLSGAEAVNLVSKNDFHIAFVDFVMPELNGLETIKAIKALKPATKAVLISGMRRDAENGVAESLANGMIDEFLQKPFFRISLRDCVKKHFGA